MSLHHSPVPPCTYQASVPTSLPCPSLYISGLMSLHHSPVPPCTYQAYVPTSLPCPSLYISGLCPYITPLSLPVHIRPLSLHHSPVPPCRYQASIPTSLPCPSLYITGLYPYITPLSLPVYIRPLSLHHSPSPPLSIGLHLHIMSLPPYSPPIHIGHPPIRAYQSPPYDSPYPSFPYPYNPPYNPPSPSTGSRRFKRHLLATSVNAGSNFTGILNPVICLKNDEVMFFSVTNTMYPVYDKFVSHGGRGRVYSLCSNSRTIRRERRHVVLKWSYNHFSYNYKI